jgi:hypothetical protein
VTLAPPWKEAKVEEDEFWSRQQPGFKALSLHARDSVKKELKMERPDLLDLYEQEAREDSRLDVARTFLSGSACRQNKSLQIGQECPIYRLFLGKYSGRGRADDV